MEQKERKRRAGAGRALGGNAYVESGGRSVGARCDGGHLSRLRHGGRAGNAGFVHQRARTLAQGDARGVTHTTRYDVGLLTEVMATVPLLLYALERGMSAWMTG